MAQTTDVSVTEFKGNATNLVNAVKKITKETKNLDASLSSVLTHLEQIEKKSLGSVTNNIGKQSHFKGTIIRDNSNVVVGANGAAITAKSSNSKGYQQAVQNYNDLQKEEIALKKESIKKLPN